MHDQSYSGPINVGIKYPTDVRAEREIGGDITLWFGDIKGSRLTVILTDGQMHRLVLGGDPLALADPLKEAALLYATDRISIEELERRLELAIEGDVR